MIEIITILLIIGLIAISIEYWPITLLILALFIALCVWIHKKRKEKKAELFIEQTYSYDNMNGVSFEYFIADLLRRNGYEKVRTTPASGDNGVDIIASKNGITYAFQCKRYSKNVGTHAVQEVFSGKAFYNASVAVVITNSYFTSSAITMARRLNVELWGRSELNSLIRSADRSANY